MGAWDLTCRDFQQLVQYKPDLTFVAPLLDDWFGYRLVGDGPDTLILNTSAEAIDPLWLHLKIQDDADKQGRLYSLAMALSGPFHK